MIEGNVVKKKKHNKTKKNTADEDEIARKYQQHEHEEHILEIPDTYIGSVEKHTENCWNVNDEKKMIKSPITYVPGLYKIFDEIVVNALDQWQRLIVTAKSERKKFGKTKANLVRNIKINVDPEKNMIEVYNDGDGIDIALHPEANMFVPSLIFGELLTSTNYDKTEKKITGGKNGYGAKLTNIFSTWFRIETVDAVRKRKFVQIFEKNMKVKNEPTISNYSSKPYTKISFCPDLKRFGMEKLDKDMVSLIKLRAYDISACTDNYVNVYYNEEKIPYKSFESYVDLYIGNKQESSRAYELVNDRWEIAATVSSDNNFEQVSFVNGVRTTKGGKHVDHVSNIIVKKLVEYIHKKKKINMEKNKSYIKDNIFVFVKAVIENPAFDSQLKETLNTNPRTFGSKCEPISDKFIEKIAKSGLMEKVMTYYEFKEKGKMKSSDGKKKGSLRGIEKLDDANWAGTKKSEECTLILTEGDSAKSMAVAGLSIVGRDKYGIFPLRGKLLNVRDKTDTERGREQMNNNKEITNLKQIIGLEANKEYHNLSSLRYGSIMIMTDQDVDGSHIKGLLINLFHKLWPSLIKHKGFLKCMLTPIIKASKGTVVISFYTLTNYEDWKKTNNNGKGWNIKYYKGLGTSTSSEAKEYFKKLKTQSYMCNDKTDDSIDKAFNKNRADDRKTWMATYSRDDILDSDSKNVQLEDFIDKELLHFSVYDLSRSVPNVIDGLKTSQRKILYSCFKRNLKKEIRVAQLAGYVSEHAAYHHGEASLNGAIVGMAQDYINSNNINILTPGGQFGTRLQGGSDSASPRYIHTRLEDIIDTVFSKLDNPILNYLDDDGLPVEPDYYVPIMPLLLMNGSKGIGTAYSTDVPKFNPLDICKNLKRKIKGQELKEMIPWYYSFKGDIIKTSDTHYLTKGKYKVVGYKTLEIFELPIGVWTDDYKDFLETLLIDYEKEFKKKKNNKGSKNKNNKFKNLLKNFSNHSSESEVKFVLEFASPSGIKKLHFGKDSEHINKLEKELKLTSTISTTNMCAFDQNCRIHKYKTANDIINEFYKVRINTYVVRKKYMLEKMKIDLDILKEKIRFINYVIDEKIIIRKKTKANIKEQLETHKFKKVNKNKFDEVNGSYDYLIGMPIYTLCTDRTLELEQECKIKNESYDELFKKEVGEIWLEELNTFSDKYKQYMNQKDKKYGIKNKVKISKGKNKGKNENIQTIKIKKKKKKIIVKE